MSPHQHDEAYQIQLNPRFHMISIYSLKIAEDILRGTSIIIRNLVLEEELELNLTDIEDKISMPYNVSYSRDFKKVAYSVNGI